MKGICYATAVCVLATAPALALAQGTAANWTGAYVGGQAGLNSASSDHLSTENALDLGVLGGYNFQVTNHVAVGGDVFYEWNQEQSHKVGGASTGDIGTNVYGLDLMAGFPLGDTGTWMPFVKVGYGWAHFNGSGAGGVGNQNDLRYGAGVEWRMTRMFGLSFQYMYQKFGSAVDNWKNQNYTAAFNVHFQ